LQGEVQRLKAELETKNGLLETQSKSFENAQAKLAEELNGLKE
jgi:chaperonin cofactor prefoldin